MYYPGTVYLRRINASPHQSGKTTFLYLTLLLLPVARDPVVGTPDKPVAIPPNILETPIDKPSHSNP